MDTQKEAQFEFAPSLQELLYRDLQDNPVKMTFKGEQSVKHLIESLRIPHTEIGLLSANKEAINLDYIVQNEDRIEVQPVAPVYLEEEPRFVLDGHLGRLTSHLRMLGLDCLYRNDYDDEELVKVSVEYERILLTRDRLLLMHKIISQGYLLRSMDSNEQLYEVFQRYRLMKWVRPFQRCMNCNHLLEPVKKETVLEKLEPLTKKYYHEFKLCPACKQVYWKGSHYERMLELIEEVSKST